MKYLYVRTITRRENRARVFEVSPEELPLAETAVSMVNRKLAPGTQAFWIPKHLESMLKDRAVPFHALSL